METNLKDNKVTGNTINIGLINNTAQANVDVNASMTTDIKFGPLKLIEACWGNKVLNYIKNYELKKQDCISLIHQKSIEKIPPINRKEPRIGIVGPVLENLKYNLDEKYIKDLFLNLLVCEMDDRTQSNVLPAYVEIIKQLSVEDAKYLKAISDCKKDEMSLCYVRLKYDNIEGYTPVAILVVDNLKNQALHTIEVPQIVFDNLERLNIVTVDSSSIIPQNEKEVENAFNFYNSHLKIDDPHASSYYKHGVLNITEFGRQFIEICCS